MEAQIDRVYKMTIPGRLPGLNEYINDERANKQKAARLKRETQELIGWYIRRYLRGLRFSGPVVMDYRWYEKDKRRDKDNIVFAKKFIQDALVAHGVIANDGWNDIEYFTDRCFVDKNKARVEVRIWAHRGDEG